jgi:hypothetical protein
MADSLLHSYCPSCYRHLPGHSRTPLLVNKFGDFFLMLVVSKLRKLDFCFL